MKNKPTYQELENELKELKRYKDVINSVSDVYYQANSDGIVTMVSSSALKLFGYLPEEVIGSKTIMSLYKDPKERKKFLKIIKEKGRAEKFHAIMLRKDGSEVFVETTANIILDENGKYVGVEGICRDISDIKKIEKELRESKEYYKEITENISDVISIIDKDGKSIYRSESYEKLMGFTVEEMLGQNVFNHIHIDDRKKLQKQLADSFKNPQKSVPIFFRAFHKDGTLRYLEGTGKNLLNSPIINGIVITYRDVTERVLAKKALEKNEAYFKEITKNISDAIAVIDADGNNLYKSVSFGRIGNYSAKERIGKNIFELVYPDDVKKLKKQLKESFEKPEEIIDFNLRIYHKDGSLKYLEGSGKNMINNPYVNGIVLNYRDVTERVLMEQNLKESEAYNKALFHCSSTPLVVMDINTYKFIDCNEAAIKIYGYKTKEEVIGKTPIDVSAPVQNTGESSEIIVKRKIKEVKEKGSVIFECQHKKSNGEIWDAEVHLMTIEYKGRKMLQFSLIDITERKKSEIALKKSEEKYRELNSTKDKFFSIIAHDLKGPFNTMLGFSQLLIDGFDDFDTKQQKEFLGYIHQGIQKNYKLLENLLLWAQTQKHTLEFIPQKQNLYLLITKTLSILNQAIINKNIKLLNNTSEKIWVMADKNMLLSVFRNLISNAIKFSYSGGEVVIETSIKRNENNQICTKISIIDNGVGIPSEKLPLLFKISENISTNGTNNESGTGLGLILCKEFIEKHDGKIWAESVEEKGSVFHFTIPAIDNY